MTRVFPDTATNKSLPWLTLRTHAIICGALFAALVGIGILGNVRRQNIGIRTLRGLIIAGLCVAIPAMIVGGAFE